MEKRRSDGTLPTTLDAQLAVVVVVVVVLVVVA